MESARPDEEPVLGRLQDRPSPTSDDFNPLAGPAVSLLLRLGRNGPEVTRMLGGLLSIVYVVIGVVIAANQNYFSGIEQLGNVLEAIIAVLIWPVLLFGVDINITGGPRIDEALRW